MGTPVPVVAVLSRASTTSVQPTALKPVLVGPDVGVAGRGQALDEGVVLRDVGRHGVLRLVEERISVGTGSQLPRRWA